jgi:dolichol-phosphate mannosyltransferase
MVDDRSAASDSQQFFRRIAPILTPLIDILVFCALIAAGHPLRSSHMTAFAVGVALNWLLRIRSLDAAARQTHGRSYARVAVVTLMALFLRGGALALLTQRWGWTPQISIFFAVAAGLAVTLPGNSYALSEARGQSRFRAFAFGVIAYIVVLRLIYAGCVELLPEETYYWNYSRHLDFGYLDHPPMVAWLIRLGTDLFGQTEFGVRAGALACGAVTSLFVYKFTRSIFDQATALAALVLAQALPFFFLSGMLMTPDAPLTAAWAASVYFLWRALIGGLSRAWWRAGISLGLGLISKYSIALLGPVTLVFMLWDPNSRRWWRQSAPYIAALLALTVFSPVIIWNAQHDWASFAFQTSRRLAEAPKFALPRLLASVLVLITPTGALAIVAALASGKNAGDEDPQIARRRRFMWLAILIPLSVFAAFSLRHEVKLDWTGALWTAALPAMACTWIEAGPKIVRFAAWVRAAWTPTIVVMLLILGAGLHYLALGLPGLGYGKHIELAPVGWRDLTGHIMKTAAAFRRETGADVLIVGMDRYAIASELAFYGPEYTHSAVDTMNSHLFGGMSLMYGRWSPPRSLQHRNLLLVAFDPSELMGPSIESRVKRLGPIEDDVLWRDGAVIRHYYHRFAYDYQDIADD